MQGKKNVLKIRCSDGRSRKPNEIRGNFIHQIRLPGGILFPDLCAQQFDQKWKRSAVSKLLRRVLLYAIDVMVELKTPEEIILMSHTPCGASTALGLPEWKVKETYIAWGNRLKKRFPHIHIRVLHECHSECGEHHDGHELLLEAA